MLAGKNRSSARNRFADVSELDETISELWETRLRPMFRITRSFLGRISQLERFYRRIVDGWFEYVELLSTLAAGLSGCTPKAKINPNTLSLHDPRNIIVRSVKPDIPFAPNHRSIPSHLSSSFFSGVEAPRGHTNGCMPPPRRA